MANKYLTELLLLIIITQSCKSQVPKKHGGLNGKWTIELSSRDIGLVRSSMTFEFVDSTFTSYTRRNADRDILGFWKSTLARIFTRDFENGSLIHITNGKSRQSGDTMLLTGIFRSAIGSYYFLGKIHEGILRAKLLDGKKEVRGQVKGKIKAEADFIPSYPTLVDSILQLTTKKIYNPQALKTKQWHQFNYDIKRVAVKMQDDIEMEFAFYYYAGKLPFSHYSLLRPEPDDIQKQESKNGGKQVILEEKSSETVFMKIETFGGSASEMDSAFSIIRKKNYKNLIVDLRDNPGGSVESGLRFATYLFDSAVYGGIFLTQKWFRKNQAPPLLKDYNGIPAFTEANFDLLMNGIHNEPALCLKIIPQPTGYNGRLFILTNKATASACEPIVYSLKQSKRAVIVGEKTAGAMLSSEFFKMAEGFSVIIPVADYYTTDGYRLDKNGVTPDIIVESPKASEYVINKLIKK